MQVNTWLGSLLEFRGEDIYRMKGILAIGGYDRRFVFQVRVIRFPSHVPIITRTREKTARCPLGILTVEFIVQGVHMMFDGNPDRAWQDGEERKSQIVFIGRDLDREILEEGFKKCQLKL